MSKKITDKISEYFTEATVGLVDRQKELTQLKYAILTREHMLLTGKAGTGKSQFAMRAFENIEESKTFAVHLTKQTTEEYVFGPLDIQEFKKGKIKHNIDDGILTADFAFIDEFFDASDVLLRSLLGVLNERVWMKAEHIKAPLHTAVLTSNYTRENEVTEAVLDRIIFKAKIVPLNKESDRLKAYEAYMANPKTKIPTITLEEINQIADKIEDPKSAKISKDIYRTYDRLAQEIIKEFSEGNLGLGATGKYLSQRTLNKALKIVKASAILDNRKDVKFKDLIETRYAFCTLNDEEEEAVFDAAYEKIVSPMIADEEIEDALSEISQKLAQLPTAKDISAEDSEPKLIEMTRSVNALITNIKEAQQNASGSKLKTKAGDLLKEIEGMDKAIAGRLYEVASKLN